MFSFTVLLRVTVIELGCFEAQAGVLPYKSYEACQRLSDKSLSDFDSTWKDRTIMKWRWTTVTEKTELIKFVWVQNLRNNVHVVKGGMHFINVKIFINSCCLKCFNFLKTFNIKFFTLLRAAYETNDLKRISERVWVAQILSGRNMLKMTRSIQQKAHLGKRKTERKSVSAVKRCRVPVNGSQNTISRLFTEVALWILRAWNSSLQIQIWTDFSKRWWFC